MSAETGTPIAPLEKALTDYRNELEKRINKAGSDKQAAGATNSSVLEQLQNKTCSYLKYKATKELYQNISQCMSITAHNEAALIKQAVEAIGTESKTLQGQLATLSKTLKGVKTEVYKVKEAACNLAECCLEKEKHEHPDLYAVLCSIEDLPEQLDSIKRKGEVAYEIADLTFCATINVSGFQGFASTDSLKGYSGNLFTEIEKFKKNIEDNCTSLSASMETSLTDRTSLLGAAASSKFTKQDASCIEIADCNTWNKSCDECAENKDQPKKGKMRLEEICNKFKGGIEESPGMENKPKMAKPKKGTDGPAF